MQIRPLTSITFEAVQQRTQLARTTGFRFDPGAIVPGRIVPDMLSMPTLQLGDPVIQLVLVKTCYLLLHAMDLSAGQTPVFRQRYTELTAQPAVLPADE